MSTVTVVRGNLLDSDAKYIAHQCNCVTRWAAHLAKDVFKRFPHADVYSPRIPLGYRDTPGTIKVLGDGEGQRFVIAMFAQVYPGGSKARLESDPDSLTSRQQHFKSCLDLVAKLPKPFDLAMAWKTGCGAAGGDWDAYMDMILEFSDNAYVDVRLYRMSGF